jgi:hypothetical protein
MVNAGWYMDDISLSGRYMACPGGTLLSGISAAAHGYPTGSFSHFQLFCAPPSGGGWRAQGGGLVTAACAGLCGRNGCETRM